jgi:hypothetical protein
VAVTWYGSTTDGVPSSTDFKGPWDVYVAQSQDAMSASPTFQQVKATTHPMHYDQVCLSGLACVAGGDRSLADFFAMALDPTTDRLVIVYDESGKVPDGASGPVAIPHVLVQDAGTSNLGTELTARPGHAVVRTGSTDPTGDAQAPYSASSLTVPEPAPPASRTNQDALDVTSVSVGPEVDLETGEPVVDGGFTVTMKIADLSAAKLQAALLDTTAQSLIWAFRWVNGYQPASLSVHWDPIRGFDGGFDDFAGASVTCLGTPSTGEPGAYDPKCITYPGATEVPMDVNADTGVIRLSAPREVLEALGAPDENGRPTVGAADQPGVSRFYGGTVFTMGNVSANELQGFLYPVDGTAAFDFVLPGPTTPGTGPGPGTGPTARPNPPTNGGPGGGGTTPSTGGLGWPIVAAGLLGAAVLVTLRRRRLTS